jgi:hypothetical protein
LNRIAFVTDVDRLTVDATTSLLSLESSIAWESALLFSLSNRTTNEV